MYYIVTIFLLIASVAHGQTKPLKFEKACSNGKRIVIAAVGDILLHHPLQLKASRTSFESLWEKALPYLNAADIVYGNLEGPIAGGLDKGLREATEEDKWDFKVYSGYPLFNYHPSLASALGRSGFDIVSTANNHALDRSSLGIDKTIDILDENGILHVGAAKRGEALNPAVIVEAQGVKVAFIACTEHTNGNKDKHNQVLTCFSTHDKALILNTIETLKTSVDAIIVTPHWGDEYRAKPNGRQVAFAHAVLDAGATAIIGAHPHVLEPVELYRDKDGKEKLVSYSLGNFVSYQRPLPTRCTMILLVGLTKTENETLINGVRYVPMFMENHDGVDKLHLRQLGVAKNDQAALKIVNAAIDEERVLGALPIITNPECEPSK